MCFKSKPAIFTQRAISLSLIIITSFVFPTGAAYAQTTCSSVVSFTVGRQDQAINEVFFADLKAEGLDEATIKPKIEAESRKAIARAMERCKSEYENLTGCLQAKLLSSSPALHSASFSARKALEEALLSDCKKQQGLCKEAKAAEIKCTVAAAAVVAPDAKGAEAGKKGEKAKK